MSVRSFLNSEKRILIAYWTVPIIVSVILLIYQCVRIAFLILVKDQQINFYESAFADFGSFSLWSFLFAYPILVLGFPFYFLFKKKGWFKLWQIALMGFSLEIVLMIILSVISIRPDLGIRSLLEGIKKIEFGYVGLAYAAIFWFLGIYKNNWVKQHAAG